MQAQSTCFKNYGYNIIMTVKRINIRTAELSDEKDLIEICHLTGDTTVDPYLLALRWCLDYLWHDTENCFVADDQDSGKVVGYILGTLDTKIQEQRMKDVMMPRIISYWRSLKPKTFSQWLKYLSLRKLGKPHHPMLIDHPAHLHINVHPDFQRDGLGSRLLAAYEENLINHTIRGYHLGVAGNNQVGISFYRKKGLTKIGQIPKTGKPIVIFFGKSFVSGNHC
jgi:ribosomal protein S18 acetylase RimI-like enzyme